MNEWTVTYAITCALLLAAIYHRRRRLRSIRWSRLAAWWLLAATTGLIAWSLLSCVFFVFLAQTIDVSLSTAAACALGAGYFASAIILAALPFYLLLLTYYAVAAPLHEGPAASLLGRLLLASFPPALALFYGYAFPLHGTIWEAAAEATPPALLGLAVTFLALALPRLLIRRLGLNHLWKTNAP